MPEATLVDWHAHLLPPELVGALRARTAAPRLEIGDAGSVRLHARSGGDPMSTSPSLLDVTLRLKELDAAGVDVQVLSVAGLMGVDSVDDESVDGLIERTNRGLAAIVADYPQRFRALASLPLRDVARAADVLENAVRHQGLAGAIISSDAFATPERAERFRPIVVRAHSLGAHIFAHPGPLPGASAASVGESVLGRLRASTTAIQNGLTEAAITLEFSDYLDGLEGARVHVANLGGNLAYLAGRWKSTEKRLGVEAPWDGRLRRIYVDTASLGADAIEFAARTFGAERLLFGSDAPIYQIAEASAAVRRLGFSFAVAA